MKKIMILPLLIMVCIFMIGCSVDNINENEFNSSSKVEVLKSQILELADDYGLNVICDVNYLAQNIDVISLDSIEKKFKGLAKLKGTYPLKVLNSKGHSNIIIKQGVYRTTRVSSFDNKNETYLCDKSFLVDMEMYYCKCRVSWTFTYTGKSDGGMIQASVSKSPFSNDTDKSYDDISYRDSGYGIVFSGRVVYKENGFDTIFHLEGDFDVNGGNITWSM